MKKRISRRIEVYLQKIDQFLSPIIYQMFVYLVWFHTKVTNLIAISLAVFCMASTIRYIGEYEIFCILAFVSLIVLVLGIFVSGAVVESLIFMCLRRLLSRQTTDAREAAEIYRHLSESNALQFRMNDVRRTIMKYYTAGYYGGKINFTIESRNQAIVRELHQSQEAVATA